MNTCKVGYILNSDKSCTATKQSGKTPIGVVSYISGSKRLAINLVSTSVPWSSSYVDISGITNITSESAALNDFSGKANTAAWISYWGSSVTNYAPGYCYNYTTTGTSKGQWYLPAFGELYATVWTNKAAVNSGLSAAGGTAILNESYWSSSEASNVTAWSVYAGAGRMGFAGKIGYGHYVVCVLAF